MVLVYPHPDEAERTSPERVRDGLTWLHHHADRGTLTAVEAWEEKKDGVPTGVITGGYMIVEVPDRAALDALLGTYPMLPTIDVDVRRLHDLDGGFAGLADRTRAAATRAHA